MDLDSVTDTSDHKAKLDLYRDALNKLVKQPSPEAWREFVDHVSGAEVALSVSRPIFSEVAASLPQLPPAMQKEAAE